MVVHGVFRDSVSKLTLGEETKRTDLITVIYHRYLQESLDLDSVRRSSPPNAGIIAPHNTQ